MSITAALLLLFAALVFWFQSKKTRRALTAIEEKLDQFSTVLNRSVLVVADRTDASSDSSMETIKNRLGKLEQLISIVLGKQKEHAKKMDQRIELRFGSINNQIHLHHERIEDKVNEIHDRLYTTAPTYIDNNPPASNQAKPQVFSEEERDQILREVAKSLEHEKIWRDQKAREFGWPIHPNDMKWLDRVQRENMFEVWSQRGAFRQEWQKPEDDLD